MCPRSPFTEKRTGNHERATSSFLKEGHFPIRLLLIFLYWHFWDTQGSAPHGFPLQSNFLQRQLSRLVLPRSLCLVVSSFMVMGLVSGLSAAKCSDSESFLVVHALFSQDGCQQEGFWEVVGHVVSPLTFPELSGLVVAY